MQLQVSLPLQGGNYFNKRLTFLLKNVLTISYTVSDI